MRIDIIRTWSGPDHSHPTLQVVTKRWFVLVWVHAFQRGWSAAYPGMWCGGFGWISFNVFNIRAS